MSYIDDHSDIHYPVCGFHPATSWACAEIRKAYGPCGGPCDAPCYILVSKLGASGMAPNDTSMPQGAMAQSPPAVR